RIPAAEITPERAAGLPPIYGLPDLARVEGPQQDVPDWKYRQFSVWLEGVEGNEVREIWFDKLRLLGPARLAGAFYLKPVRELLIAPAQLFLDGAALQGVAEELRGRVLLRLGPIDVRSTSPETGARMSD